MKKRALILMLMIGCMLLTVGLTACGDGVADDPTPTGNGVVHYLVLKYESSMEDEYLSRTLETGTIQFTVSIAREPGTSSKVTFTSSNEAVATISSGGLATLLSVGQTTITARSVANPAFSNSITLNVKPNPTDANAYAIKLNGTGGEYAQQDGVTVTAAFPQASPVYLYSAAPAGQELKKWVCNSGNAEVVDGLWGKVEPMPAAPIEFTAVYGPKSEGVKLRMEGIKSEGAYTVTPVTDTDYTSLKIDYTNAGANSGFWYYSPTYNTVAIGGMGNDAVVPTNCSVSLQNHGTEDITITVGLRQDAVQIGNNGAQTQIVVPAGDSVTEVIACNGKLTMLELIVATGGTGSFTVKDITFRQVQ